ncbi:MAG: MBL fold metallo-hydrolase [Anaerolineales bacterium]|nr:MBL fold metallo-hydrolase [Anaerolineales bacterium]
MTGESMTVDFEKDVLATAAGDLAVTFLGHASLLFAFGGKQIYIDPFGEAADYSKLPPADAVLVTHHHFDHFDLQALGRIRTQKTRVVYTPACAAKQPGGIVMGNGDAQIVEGIPVEAVPAYNLVHKRPSGEPYHIRGEGNGYILTFGDTRVYVAGDTENVPEMKNLERIAVAFLPVNLPYTMSPEMAADAARTIRPRILYPYHFSDTDMAKLVGLLKNEQDIEVRIRNMA